MAYGTGGTDPVQEVRESIDETLREARREEYDRTIYLAAQDIVRRVVAPLNEPFARDEAAKLSSHWHDWTVSVIDPLSQAWRYDRGEGPSFTDDYRQYLVLPVEQRLGSTRRDITIGLGFWGDFSPLARAFHDANYAANLREANPGPIKAQKTLKNVVEIADRLSVPVERAREKKFRRKQPRIPADKLDVATAKELQAEIAKKNVDVTKVGFKVVASPEAILGGFVVNPSFYHVISNLVHKTDHSKPWPGTDQISTLVLGEFSPELIEEIARGKSTATIEKKANEVIARQKDEVTAQRRASQFALDQIAGADLTRARSAQNDERDTLLPR